MTTPKAAEVRLTPDQYRGEWLQVMPGERFKIRVSSAQTMGAYSVIEIVADPCACRKLNPNISVMESAQDWATKNVPSAIDGARDRCIFPQG
jgi:hypothetical protein